ncbi:antA/AntB antirepressor family protein [Spirosoma pollinicola]|uniref:AntA/AntB antirepressor domain-containing protein n=1 Tax=Spirosoma pollinicola TaxID=2057025 RepID=A0A2K8ZAV7_9BACT|nr:antA/AntB antirepressor family protein [Spirosoma pollinicola]AUD06998.1 hypothetical protein CWM47_37375 [Spirosoma pollinicola]
MSTIQAPVAVIQHPILGPAVSGRAIYAATSISNASRDIFSDWFRHKQSKLDLIEGKDFITTSVNLAGSSRKYIEHTLTIDAAQRLAEIAPAKRGVELAAYLKYYPTAEPTATELQEAIKGESIAPEAVAPILLFSNLGVPPTIELQPDPSPVIEPEPLTPVQKLLAEVQKLAEDEAKRKNEPVVPSEEFKGMEARLEQVEKQLTSIGKIFYNLASLCQPESQSLFPGFDRPGAYWQKLPDLDPTTRVKITRLVDGYAAAKTVTHQEVWKHLYGHLSSRFSFDAWQYAQGKKNPNYLDIIEENGQLENLYNIAVELLTLSQR